jgi:hypothetical protein
VRVTSFPQAKETRAEIAQGITEVVRKATEIPKNIFGSFFNQCPKVVGRWEEDSSRTRSEDGGVESIEQGPHGIVELLIPMCHVKSFTFLN